MTMKSGKKDLRATIRAQREELTRLMDDNRLLRLRLAEFESSMTLQRRASQSAIQTLASAQASTLPRGQR
jgi:hypothetical protein